MKIASMLLIMIMTSICFADTVYLKSESAIVKLNEKENFNGMITYSEDTSDLLFLTYKDNNNQEVNLSINVDELNYIFINNSITEIKKIATIQPRFTTGVIRINKRLLVNIKMNDNKIKKGYLTSISSDKITIGSGRYSETFNKDKCCEIIIIQID